MFSGTHKTFKSFTLIELLIVLVIIGILAVSLIPRLTGAQDRAKIVSIKAQLRTIQAQAMMYHAEYGTYAELCNKENTTIHESIQPMINSLKSIVGDTRVRCVVRTSDVPHISPPHYIISDSLETINFAVAVQFKGVHYAVDVFGVVTLDQEDQGGSTNWTTAMSRCQNLGKRLPSIEILKAIRDMYGSETTPDFSPNIYRSSTESISDTTRAYTQLFTISININTLSKAAARYVRCVE